MLARLLSLLFVPIKVPDNQPTDAGTFTLRRRLAFWFLAIMLTAGTFLVWIGMHITTTVLSSRADNQLQKSATNVATAIDRASHAGELPMPMVRELLFVASTRDVELDVVDATGEIIASSSTRPDRVVAAMAIERALDAKARTDATPIVHYTTEGVEYRAMVSSANDGVWRVLAHMPESSVLSPLRTARPYMAAGLVVVLLLMFGAVLLVNGFFERRIGKPMMQVTSMAEAAANGYLSHSVRPLAGEDEVARLSRATVALVSDLHRIVTVAHNAADQGTGRSSEITHASEPMTTAAHDIAARVDELYSRSTTIANLIHYLGSETTRLTTLANELAHTTHAGAQRHTQLSTLAKENCTRLDNNVFALSALSSDTEQSALAAQSVIESAEEFRAFVALIQKMAKQSKLLALNAAMEASRAGEMGQGFAVVASEVRRLAANSAEAAEKTDKLLRNVLEGARQSRAANFRTTQTIGTALDAAKLAAEASRTMEDNVAQSMRSTASSDQAVATATALATTLTAQLDQIATEMASFVDTVQLLASTADEQTSSTQKIRAAATDISTSSQELTELIRRYRLESEEDVVQPTSPDLFFPSPVRSPRLASA